MADDVVLNKAASIERCVARALEEYEAGLRADDVHVHIAGRQLHLLPQHPRHG
jgi:hypothetical protein